jgi:3-hydroxyacyl-[acyl-carrier-protein] dehydratase
VRFTDSITVDASAGTSRGSLFVDATADYLKDHFPGAPTLPGLVMLESAVRAASAIWEAAAPEAEGTATLEHVERLQIVRPVVPGETLIVDAAIDAGDGGSGRRWFMARATVDGETAMRARFRLIRGDTR